MKKGPMTKRSSKG